MSKTRQLLPTLLFKAGYFCYFACIMSEINVQHPLTKDENKTKPDGPMKQFFRKVWEIIKIPFLKFDQKVDGAATFFVKNYGKTKFMVAMSKKVQYLGIEKLWNKGPKAFIYFFLFYLIRDTILYIIIPIMFARATTS